MKGISTNDIIDSNELTNINPNDYFKIYKKKMETLQKEKYLVEKDTKFHDYLTRLVDAKKIKEVERLNGPKMLKEFILDKNSLVQSKKKRIYEQS